MRCVPSSLFAGLAVLLAWPLAVPAQVAGPSAVLTKAEERLGTNYVSFAGGSRDRAELGDDKTLSPYLYVAGGDPATERLPLKETTADIQIAGVIAKVRVRQVFENAGTKAIEAGYVFPASTRAAVHGMRMKIGARTVVAKIECKQAAREQYEQAKSEGKRASLLEQERPNVFTMNVANLMPKDRVEVELDYSEMLVPEDAVYEFVYPTVVGPRYAGGSDARKDQWMANPHLKEGEQEPYKFDLTIQVETGIPLKELSSPSHKIDVNPLGPSSAKVALRESGGGNKDFVLRYRLAGDQVETGLLMWKGEKENFFAMMMEPPRRPTLAQIPPREYIFLLDVSGSMHGYPLDTAKELMRKLLGQLRENEYFNIALFSGGSYVMSPEGSLPATRDNVQLATELISSQRGGGGTELMGGLRAAYAVPKKDRSVSRSVVVVTDGYVGVEAQTFKFVREHLDEANVFAFGIGSSVNRALIEGLARAGQGEPFVVLRPDKAPEQAERLRKYIEQPVLSNLKVKFGDFDAYEVAPMKLPDLMARRPVVLFGKFRGEPKGSIELSGYSGGGEWKQKLEVKPAAVKAENGPLRWLWARKWVEILDDAMAMTKAKELEDAITDLGLSYSLLTSFTSFVAVDSEVANKAGQGETVRQPLPLPEGVSERAMARSRGGLGYASGSGGGGPAPSASAPLTMAPPPPPSGKARPSRKLALRDEADKDLTRGMVRVVVADAKAAGLSDAKELLQALQERLQKAAASCGATAGTLELKLTVDRSGKVVKVEVVRTSAGVLGECARKTLTGMSSKTVSTAATGTYELTLRFVVL